MSFPFYNYFSSKAVRTKDTRKTGHKHASAPLATGAFNQGVVPLTANTNHPRNSGRMRLIPFLGKRRKSLATLRPSAITKDDATAENHGHHKSVPQLANEWVEMLHPTRVAITNLPDRTAARLARSSLGAAGSRSTGNLELPAFDTSPLRFDVHSAYATPAKNRPLDVRHTMFPSGSTKNSTPDKQVLSQNKRNSEKPAKSSFLSRISSRPSLSSRYSSADLKSASKGRGLFKSADKRQASPVTPRRKDMIHPLHIPNGQVLGDDKNFFTSPRAAPTPPNMSFASPDSSLLDSPVGPSQSAVTLPSQKQSPSFLGVDCNRSPESNSVKHAHSSQLSAKHNSISTRIASAGSLSPEGALRSPRRHSVSVHGQSASPVSMKTVITANSASGSPAARPRGSHVRIGKEKVTISVANVLEAELGVEVGDSEDSSYYDDSYEETRRFGSQISRSTLDHVHGKPSANDSSDLPPLSSSADSLDLSFKFPETKGEFSLESQSPLSALMSASAVGKDYSASATSVGYYLPISDKEAKEDQTSDVSGMEYCTYKQSAEYPHERPVQNARSAYLHSLAPQSCEVDRLDRISERSISVRQESPRDVEDKDKEAVQVPSKDNSPALASQLQRALDAQCARFDKLAGHLLQIIQRHQNEKVQVESQIATLQKEARRNEREIKALRKLVMHSDKRSSQDAWNTRRLVRVASMQSFLSNVSAGDEEVDMSVAVEMLARAGRRSAFLSPDLTRDLRASVDLSPRATTPTKIEKTTDLRRSKTMPDLHKVTLTIPSSAPSPLLQDTSPDVSGLGLGLDFPLPEPLKLPSIASTIMSSTKESSISVPALTAASTALSDLSFATESNVNSVGRITSPSLSTKSVGVERELGRSAREKRMAGEWRPGRAQGLYEPADQKQPLSAPPSCKIPALPAATSYANNLNKALIASPIEQVMKPGSPDLDAIYKKLVSNSNGLLE